MEAIVAPIGEMSHARRPDDRDVGPDFEQMWRDLAPVGRSSSTGGYFRQPFAAAERELAAWFVEQCQARSLEVERTGSATPSAGGGPRVPWSTPAC